MKSVKLLFFFCFLAAKVILAQQVSVFNSPNVGVSTLRVNKTGMGIDHRNSDNSVGVGSYVDGGAAYIQTHTNHALNFATNNGTAQMTLSTTGNVGIGTTTPASLLHLSRFGSEVLRLENASPLLANTMVEMYFKNGTQFTGAIKTIGTDAQSARLALFTSTGAGNSSLLERFTISDAGNVGIGTNNPTTKLDLIGKLRMADGTQANGLVLTSDANGLASWKAIPQVLVQVRLSTMSMPNANTWYPIGGAAMINNPASWNSLQQTFTAPIEGYYHVQTNNIYCDDASVAVTYNFGYQFRLYVNNTSQQGPFGFGTAATKLDFPYLIKSPYAVNTIIYLNAGDQLQLRMSHNHFANVELLDSFSDWGVTSSILTITRL